MGSCPTSNNGVLPHVLFRNRMLPIPEPTSGREVYIERWGYGLCLAHSLESFDGRLVIHNNMQYHEGIMSNNEKTISFRALAEKIAALDTLAAAQDRPRSYLINEAITNYIELHAYQDALVRKGLEEMRKGRVVSHEEVLKRLKRTGRARQ
jgi:predicted transcriptional regulator